MKSRFLGLLLLLCVPALAKKPDPPPIASMTPSTEEIRQATTKQLQGQSDLVRRFIRRLGNKTIEMQGYLSIEGNFDNVAPLMASFLKDPAWALQNVNESPSGRNYYFKIVKAWTEPSNVIAFSFTLDLPLYHTKGARKFKVTGRTDDGVYILQADTIIEPDSVIASCTTKMYAFPSKEPNRIYIAVISRIEIKTWILYEALPERVLNNESTERLEIVIRNYQKQEDLLVQSKMAGEKIKAVPAEQRPPLEK